MPEKSETYRIGYPEIMLSIKSRDIPGLLE